MIQACLGLEPNPAPPLPADDSCAAALRAADLSGARNYYRARYYDPKIGRFINEDPMKWFGGMNHYAYAGNNPTTFTDL